jgi:hypothetical protein
MSDRLATLVHEFCFNTICGHESGFYKFFVMKDLDLDALKGDMSNMIKFTTANYLNSAYKSLIKKDDEYIIEKFGEMMQINNHSAICLLNIISAVILDVHIDLDRKLLNTKSYQLYMGSLQQQLTTKSQHILDILVKNLSHSCTGTDISTCDPDKPMFVLSTTFL